MPEKCQASIFHCLPGVNYVNIIVLWCIQLSEKKCQENARCVFFVLADSYVTKYEHYQNTSKIVC